MVASLLRVLHSGPQNERLNTNSHGQKGVQPSTKFFQKIFRRTGRFTTQWMRLDFNTPPQFGQQATAVLPRKGHLLSRIYLITNYPTLSNTIASWINNVGTAIIDSTELQIGGARIERLDAPLMELLDEFNTPIEKVPVVNKLVGRYDNNYHTVREYSPYLSKISSFNVTFSNSVLYSNLSVTSNIDPYYPNVIYTSNYVYTTSNVESNVTLYKEEFTSAPVNTYKSPLSNPLITATPLPFFFSRNDSAASLPVDAIQTDEIRLQVNFRSLNSLIQNYSVIKSVNTNLSVSNVGILTSNLVLSNTVSGSYNISSNVYSNVVSNPPQNISDGGTTTLLPSLCNITLSSNTSSNSVVTSSNYFLSNYNNTSNVYPRPFTWDVTSNWRTTSNYIQPYAILCDSGPQGSMIYNYASGTVSNINIPAETGAVYSNIFLLANTDSLYASYDFAKTWSNINFNLETGAYSPIYYANGLWVSIFARNEVWYSSDTSNWYRNSSLPTPFQGYQTIIYNSNDSFWLLGSYSNYFKLNNISDSTYQLFNAPGVNANAITYGNGIWLACYNNGVFYSSDTSNWNPVTGLSGQYFFGAAYGGGYWTIININSVFQSSNGSNFYQVSTGYHSLWDIKYINSNWMISDTSLPLVYPGVSNIFYLSTDISATNWTPISIRDSTNAAQKIAISADVQFAVLSNIYYTSNRVYTDFSNYTSLIVTSNIIGGETYYTSNYTYSTVSNTYPPVIVSYSNYLPSQVYFTLSNYQPTVSSSNSNYITTFYSQSNLVINSQYLTSNLTSSNYLTNFITISAYTLSNISENHLAVSNITVNYLSCNYYNIIPEYILTSNITINTIVSSNLFVYSSNPTYYTLVTDTYSSNDYFVTSNYIITSNIVTSNIVLSNISLYTSNSSNIGVSVTTYSNIISSNYILQNIITSNYVVTINNTIVNSNLKTVELLYNTANATGIAEGSANFPLTTPVTLGDTYLLAEYIYLDAPEANRFRIADISLPITQHYPLQPLDTQGLPQAQIDIAVPNPVRDIFFYCQPWLAPAYNAHFLATKYINSNPNVLEPWWPDAQGLNPLYLSPLKPAFWPDKYDSEPITSIALQYEGRLTKFSTENTALFRHILPSLEQKKAPWVNRYYYNIPFGVQHGITSRTTPTGEVNYDKISRRELQLTFPTASDGTSPRLWVRPYVETYNILRIYGGRAGTLFGY